MDLIAVGLNASNAPNGALDGPARGAALARAEARVRALAGACESVRLVLHSDAWLLLGASHPLRKASTDSEAGSAVVASPRRGGPAALSTEARRILAEEAGVVGKGADTTIVLVGAEAFRKLVRLACGHGSDVWTSAAGVTGTDSLDEMRAAYADAVVRGRAGRILGGTMHRVFRAARRVRTQAGVPSAALVSEATGDVPRPVESLIDEETARWVQWRIERSAASTVVRLGRLLELSAPAPKDEDPEGRGAARTDRFRTDLLKAFAAMAREARDEDEASSRLALFEEALKRAAASAADAAPPLNRARRHGAPGRVSLVGAGPGAEGLLTLKGARLLADADVVYYDALPGEDILAHCRPGTRLVPVGKRRGHALASQEEIEEALVREARAGLRVVRLKGGDPFVFGRGGEEGLALLSAGVPFEIVPGVSSGLAGPALAGIPLTHRGVSSSAAFVTAHDLGAGDGAPERRERLAHLARGAETLVIFMAGAELGRVRATLLEAGLAPETPAALVESAATADQRATIGTLDDLERAAAGLRGGPALVIIGRTVDLAASLGRQESWTAGDTLDARPAAPLQSMETHIETDNTPRRSRQERRRAG